MLYKGALEQTVMLHPHLRMLPVLSRSLSRCPRRWMCRLCLQTPQQATRLAARRPAERQLPRRASQRRSWRSRRMLGGAAAR